MTHCLFSGSKQPLNALQRAEAVSSWQRLVLRTASGYPGSPSAPQSQ